MTPVKHLGRQRARQILVVVVVVVVVVALVKMVEMVLTLEKETYLGLPHNRHHGRHTILKVVKIPPLLRTPQANPALLRTQQPPQLLITTTPSRSLLPSSSASWWWRCWCEPPFFFPGSAIKK